MIFLISVSWPNLITSCQLMFQRSVGLYLIFILLSSLKFATELKAFSLFTCIQMMCMLLNSPKWCPTFLLNSLGEFSFSYWIACSV